MSAITFDPKKHAYSMDGAVVPSVTALVQRAGLIDTQFFTEEGRERGTAVHKAIRYEIIGWPVYEAGEVAIGVREYVGQWIRFINAAGFSPVHSEHIVHSTKHRYCGTLDVYGKLNGRWVIIDIKTGERNDAACKAQLGLYSIACREMGLPVQELYCLELRPKRFVLTPYLRTVAESAGLKALKTAKEIV